MHLSSIQKPWGVTFTQKRYLHPPLAENMVTMWANSMILIGEIRGGRDSQASLAGRFKQSTLPSSAVIFTLNGKFMPRETVKYKTRKDGYPIHALSKDIDGVRFCQEAFCDNDRVPTAYIRVSLENITDSPLSFTFGAMVRTGPEFSLIGCIEPDAYYTHQSLKPEWLSMPKFKKSKGKLTDGVYTLRFSGGEFVTERFEDDLSTPVTLKPREKKILYFSFSRSYNTPERYSLAKERAEAFWKKELAKAKNIPNYADEGVFNNLLTQMLQSFCYTKEDNYVLLRQGGLQRYIWPNEAVSVIEALSKIGGYESYLRKVIDTYFNVLQTKEGEDKGQVTNFGIGWGGIPGAVLESFAYAAENDEYVYKTYYDDALLAFRWIEKKRAETKADDLSVGGLFPAWRPSDYGSPRQVWAYTDCFMLQGYQALLNLFIKKNAPDLKEIEDATKDYRATIQKVFDDCVKDADLTKTLILPRDAHNDKELEKQLVKEYINFCHPQTILLKMGFAGYETPVALAMQKYFKDLKCKNYFYFPSGDVEENGGRKWYTSFGEYDMFLYHKNGGNDDFAKKIVDAQLKYVVNNEYYMSERQDSHDCYYAPWQPNASASGRTVSMLFGAYGKK